LARGRHLPIALLQKYSSLNPDLHLTQDENCRFGTGPEVKDYCAEICSSLSEESIK